MATPQQWLQAGQSLLAQHGKQKLTLAALCRQAGASKGSFYNHFATLPDFLQALERHLQQQGKPAAIHKDTPDDRKKPWFEMALQILEQQGYAYLTLDELNTRMGVTKGAFYYLFKSRQQFVGELLAYWEQHALGELLALAMQPKAAHDTVETILTMNEQLSRRRAIDVQIRAWALVDKQVARFQETLDAHQLQATREVIRKLFTLDDKQLDALARVAYFSYIGSQQFLPRVSEREWSESLKVFMPLLGR